MRQVQTRPWLRSLLVLALLMMGVSGAWGQDFYVIKAGNNFLAHTNATTIGNATTFNAETCLWTISGDNIIAISPDGTTGNTLGYTSSGNNAQRTYSLRLSNNSDAWTDATSQPYVTYSYGTWTTTTRNFYPRYNNGWGMNYTGDTRATVTKVTFSDAPNTSASSSTTYSASISGDDIIYSTGTYPYTADITQTITYNQTIRTFSGYANSGTTTATINKPYPVSSAYTGTPSDVNWSVSPITYGNINNSTGVLSVTSLPANMASITITYTAQASGQSVTGTMQVNMAKDQATYESLVVTLDDREDHTWAYYNKELGSPIRSWNPADVKITYFGDGIVMTGNADYTASSTDFVKPGQTNYTGGAKVNVGGEDENTFIYYKTLERIDGSTSANPTGRCAYTTIPNPFQVRPTYGTPPTSNRADWTGWRGFQCWRLKSVSGGSIYSAASGGSALS